MTEFKRAETSNDAGVILTSPPPMKCATASPISADLKEGKNLIQDAEENTAMTKCPVCLDPMRAGDKRPVTLTCAHTLCADCAAKSDASGHSRCPVCRHPHLLDPELLAARRLRWRQQYGHWRAGAAAGASGEITNIGQPPKEPVEELETAASSSQEVSQIRRNRSFQKAEVELGRSVGELAQPVDRVKEIEDTSEVEKNLKADLDRFGHLLPKRRRDEINASLRSLQTKRKRMETEQEEAPAASEQVASAVEF